MDHGSSTPVDKEVLDEMLPYFSKFYGNASSIHSDGIKAFDAIEQAREDVANIIGAKSDEIIFTSGGTESDNLGIKGLAFKKKNKRKANGYNIITSSIEHPGVLDTCKYMEEIGFNVKFLSVDKYGIIDLEELKNSISKDTFLISIMYGNNEIGTVEPITEIGKIAKENDIVFHTDAVQAIGKEKIDVKKQNIDSLSISSHKIYGPKGVGALYIKKGTPIQTIQHGGGHEKGLRSSTYNTPGIVGLGKACKLALKRYEKDVEYQKTLRNRLIDKISKIESSYLNGHPTKRLVNNAHFRFSAIEGESLNLKLDDKGISAATGSACSSKKLQASHVLLAIGLKPEEAHGSLRLTLGRTNTKEDVDYVAEVLPKIVTELRNMSPLWNR
jgi:cysteine desulfurase